MMAEQYGRISVKIMVLDAFWHPAFGIVLLLLLQIGPRYTTMSAYYYHCDEDEARAIAGRAVHHVKPPNARAN